MAKIILRAYLCVIFHAKLKKLPFLAFLTWFLFLGKIQDGDHCLWRHGPPAAPPPLKYTSSYQEDQRLSTEGKIVSKYCNISKTLGRGSIHPLQLCTTGDMNLRVRPWVKSGKTIQSFWSESIQNKVSCTLILKLFLDIWRISHGKLFQIFTSYLEKDSVCLSNLKCLS